LLLLLYIWLTLISGTLFVELITMVAQFSSAGLVFLCVFSHCNVDLVILTSYLRLNLPDVDPSSYPTVSFVVLF